MKAKAKSKAFPETLWELLGFGPRAKPPPTTAGGDRRRTATHARYDALVVQMKRTYGIRVRKWRRSTTGCAWVVRYSDGTESRLIEAPYPTGPVSCAIFLHEVGHHAIGFSSCRLRCLEEYHAWQWALNEMRARDLNVTDRVQRRMTESLRYALRKARSRGLKTLPEELRPYL